MPIKTYREKDGLFVALALGDLPYQRVLARDACEAEASELARDGLEELEDGFVSPSLLKARTAGPGESYEEYLDWHGLLGHGFYYDEIVSDQDTDRLEPAATLWPNIIPTLALAYLLREEMVAAGASGLNIAAAYRPASKRKASRHKLNAALDLDVLRNDRHRQGAMLRIAARIYRDHADDFSMGAGTYQPPRAAWASRVHFDAGTGGPRPRAWQYFNDQSIRPSAIGKISERER